MPPPSVRATLTAGAVTSLVAGAATGLVDGLWSWGQDAQFVPEVGGRLRVLVYLASAYGMVALAAGVAIAAVLLFYSRVTRLGDLLRHAWREHDKARAAGDPKVVSGLTFVIVFTDLALGGLGLAFWRVDRLLDTRKNYHLVIAIAMLATVGALAVAALLAFAFGRLLEWVITLASGGKPGRVLSSPWAPLIAGGVLLGAHAVIAVALTWSTLRLLPLRPFAITGLGLALAAGFWPSARRLAARLTARPVWTLPAGIAGAEVLLCIVALIAGNRTAVIESAFRYSGAGEPIGRTLRLLGDWDGDGYSRFLGGGDCDDSDPDVHPGAVDIPDDGIDQNCIGGDATIKRAPDDLAFTGAPASLPRDFNVLLITIDTTRADHLGMYGYGRDTTPNLDALAAESTVFENAWAHAPSTRYSMPAILTGRYPLDVYYDTSVQGWPGLLPRATTIAEILGPLGFTTSAILNHWYFDSPQGSPNSRHFDQGFSHFDDTNQKLHPGVPGKGPAETRGSSSKEQTDSAIAWLDGNAQKRFFLWIHYYDPHYAYERHDGIDFGSADMDLYDGEIKYTDQHLGRLFDSLKARGLWDKTVIVVTGDHGEGFGEHGVYQHGYHLYAAQTKVPLIVRIPGQPGRRVKAPAGHVDILPTIADLAGGQPATWMQGRSLVGILAGTADPDADRPVFQQLSYENNHEMRGAATEQCHVIYNVSPVSSWEVYRVDRDPGETHDLADDPGPCAKVEDELGRWYDAEQVPPDAADALLSGPPDIAHPLDVDFGSEVRLLAVDLPPTVAAGGSIDVTWTFEARGRLTGGWGVFAHVVDATGRTAFQGDHTPAWPFDWWHAGQYIRYTRTVMVPRGTPPGTYRILAGVWKGAARRPARGDVPISDDAAEVAHFEVTK